ncbi:ATP-binding protein [Streptomyces sp. NPDC001315]|uniref:ATP-binding protein n=1 Tax=Streptomyces sp. NPDC001315 TaxID=3364562 RepID=UPI0036B1A183
MSSPASRAVRSLSEGAIRSGGTGTTEAPARTVHCAHPGERPLPEAGAPSGSRVSAALHITCDTEGFALARAFTRGTLHDWSLDHCADEVLLVMSELASNAAEHAVPQAVDGDPDVRLGLDLAPAHLLLTVSDHADNPPVHQPDDDVALAESGRGLSIVEALSEDWGWTARPPAGKTVWAKLSTRLLT